MSKLSPKIASEPIAEADAGRQEFPLRRGGPFVRRSSWPVDAASEPPRALKTLARIVDGDLCHRCGSCVGICPTKVLGVDAEEYPTIVNLGACTDCDLCVKVCPGDEFDALSIARQLFGEAPDLRDMHGHFDAAYLTYARDAELRKNSTSGGLVTGLLISMLEAGEIDGAIVVGSDDVERWKGKPLIARTPEELLATTKSKYAIAPTNVTLTEVRETPGRYAFVGLPCQVHGVQKAMRLDRRVKERIALTIGLFCHAAVEHEPMKEIWNNVISDCGPPENIVRFISRVGKHPGTPHVELKDGSLRPVYFPRAENYRPSSMEIINILYRLYTPARCLTCYDSTSEFADIAVGDPWMAPPAKDIDFYDGYSFTLARTAAGKQALDRAVSRGALVALALEEKAARTSNTMMGEEKRWRAFRVIETQSRQGKPVPTYGFETPRASGKQLFLTECNMLSHVFCFLPKYRLSVLRFAFSRWGYLLLWCNHKKRRLREWRRNLRASIRRAIRGKDDIISEPKGAAGDAGECNQADARRQ